jgi:hypothetical protein
LPGFVAETLLTTRPDTAGGFFAGGVPILYVIKHYGPDGARALSFGDVDMTRIDWSFLADLSMQFAARYNTNFIDYAPPGLRSPLLGLLASLDVGPYNERDWNELEIVRQALIPVLTELGIMGLPQ